MAEFKETAESKELDKEGLSENESSGPSSEVQEQRTSELEQEDNDSLEGDETESESEDTSEGDESDTPEQTGEAEREQPLMTETKEGNSDIGEEDTLDDNSEQNEPLDIDGDSDAEATESSTELPEEDDSKNEPLDTGETSETDKAEPSDDTQDGSDANEEKIDPCEQKSESKNDNVDDGSGEDEIPPPEALGYQEGEMPLFDENASDLEKAQDDLDFAKSQMEEYQKAIDRGEVERDPEVERQLQDAIDYSNEHLNDVQNGQSYSYDRPSDYWASPEGRAVAGDIYGTGTSILVKNMGKQIGLDIPSGDNPINNASKAFGKFYGTNYGYKNIGKVADASQDLMRNTHAQYDTPGDKYKQSHFMRNADGVPITASEGRSIAFNDEMSKDVANDKSKVITPEQANELKERIYEAKKQRAEHPSGYNDFDQGKTNILTNEPTKLSSKNFDRLAEERGLTPEEAADKKYSMQEYRKPDPSLNGAEHHPDKSPEQYATTRHILEPEQAINYNSGVRRNGSEHASSGEFLTPDIQSAPGRPEQAVAQENLALGKYNDARVRSETTINPTLNNGKQHNVIEGTVAPQNTEDAADIFKAGDNLDRHGGAKQIITDGGYKSGSVTEGASHNIGDMETDLNNPNLFDIHPKGKYGYTDAFDGKSGFGQLDNSKVGVRDSHAQRIAGGEDRRPTDDGGHYIANMFNGDPGSKNLDPQDRSLNRGDWKSMENKQNALLNDDNMVFTNNRSAKKDGSDRPDSYDAYTIVQHQDGTREAFSYYFDNEPKKKN